jgi:hypothetical protein
MSAETDRLSQADRFALLAELERLADNCNQVAVVLDREGAGGAALILEHAAELVAAAAWVLERPVRQFIPGWIPQAAGSGRDYRAPGPGNGYRAP